MREVNAILGEDIFLGRCGEKKATCVVFNVSEWQRTYGEGTVHLIHQRNGDKAPYPCNIVQDGGVVAWVIDLADVAVAGRGRAELQYFVGDALVKSDIYHTATERALGPASEKAPAPYESWMSKMQETANEITESAEKAAESEEAAAQSAAEAKASEETAKNCESLTLSYLEDAKTQAGFAEAAADEATAAMRSAEASATSAAASEANAAVSAQSVKADADRAEAARDSIVLDEEKMAQAVESAEASASAAAASKTAAATSASNAAASAQSVGNAAATASAAATKATIEADRAKAEADRAAGAAGGDFATRVEAQAMADEAEDNANAYTDKKIAAIPTPDVSGQITEHNTDGEAHSDIRELADSKVSKGGDTMTGALEFKPSDSEGYGRLYKNANSTGDYGLQLLDADADGNFMGFTLSASLQKLGLKKKRAGDSEYSFPKLYDTDNPPTAYEVGALPVTGGTITSDLTVDSDYGKVNMQASEGHRTTLMKNADSTNDYGTILRDTNGDAVVELKLSAANGNVKLAKDGKEYVLYHEGNNPTPDVSGQISNHNTSEEAHKDIREAVNSKAPAYTYGTTDLTAGSSELETGKLYFVYE